MILKKARDINPARVLAETIGQRPQNLIADGMAVSVVDPLEVVDIEHQRRKGPPETQSAFEFTFTQLEKSAPVEQSRQFVGHGDLFDLVVESRVADGDRGLRGKHAQHLQIRLGVLVRQVRHDIENAEKFFTPADGHPHQRAGRRRIILPFSPRP